LGSNLG